MITWVAPKAAAEILKKQDPNTAIKEKTIRTLIKQGFPCLMLTKRCLINIDTFPDDLVEFSKRTAAGRMNEFESHPAVINGIRKINTQ